ncbi:hypothetical protein DMUE_3991 [Dictyocoela muelleri]|nr:hypothetical protein DMUE_3991 [Dictyocoela muelleri]
MKYEDLVLFLENNTDLHEFLIAKRLIFSTFVCTICDSICIVESKGNKDNFKNKTWRCNNRSCRKRYPFTKGSFFEGFKIEPKIILKVFYLYCLDIKRDKIAEEVGINIKTLRSILNRLYDKIISSSEIHNNLLGENQIVEVDETHIVSKRDQRGRINIGERYWVIGLIERNTSRIRLKLVRSRNSRICSDFVLNNVIPGATVISDCWRGYSELLSLGYDHLTINHRVAFVDPENPIIHTQNIESLWNSLKRKLPKFSSFNNINRFLKVFEYNYNNRNISTSSKFEKILDIIGNLD